MTTYMKISREDKIIAKGSVTKVPYKHWWDVSSVSAGNSSQLSGFASGQGGGGKLTTEVQTTLENLDIIRFAISRDAERPFDVQFDFIADGGKKPGEVVFSVKLTSAMVVSASTSTSGDTKPSAGVAFVGVRIEHTYGGSAGKGTPSWTWSPAKP